MVATPVARVLDGEELECLAYNYSPNPLEAKNLFEAVLAGSTEPIEFEGELVALEKDYRGELNDIVIECVLGCYNVELHPCWGEHTYLVENFMLDGVPCLKIIACLDKYLHPDTSMYYWFFYDTSEIVVYQPDHPSIKAAKLMLGLETFGKTQAK